MKPRPGLLQRSYPLDDISVRSDGRTVIAHAAVFGDPYEVIDDEGHYFEEVNRTAFNRTLQRGGYACLFNHGMTIYHTPSERFSMPLGTPQVVRADEHGLLTETLYAKTELADEVLALIEDGAIRGMSFRGGIFQSRNKGTHDGLPLIERVELGLRDYGPCTYPMNPAAQVLAIRSLRSADDNTNNELSERLRRAVQDRFVEDDSDSYAWVDDFSITEDDLWLVYNVDGHYYRISYSCDDEGEVTLEGDPTEVERRVTYDYVEASQSASIESRSTPPGPRTTTTPLAVPAPGASLDLLTLAQANRRRR